MIQEKFNQRAESYEIENARTKIVNESNRELKEKISSKPKVEFEGYSKKKELQGIIPEEKSDLNLNPVEKQKLEQE